ncbi:TSUP family transporter [Ruminococcus bicirculans (ex Wegman et al. 2014)]|uniref:TSUP family transporter n=1 Tax=Ruminococcus bicirculans (ex Wegman et al. 2014) TaxID=1160721 RepID=UPI003FD7A01D
MAFLTGIFASMGLGGGMVLIVYLTVFAGFSQLLAQGINLVFFIPIAIISLVLHTKNKLVEWKKAVPAVLWGTAAVIISAWLANRIEQSLLSKAFGIFLILMGLKELFFKSEKHKFKRV